MATIAAKKYAEKVAPGLAQKAYNLNKAPNVTRTVSRGNTITPRNKPSGLGLASNPSNSVVSDVVIPKVTTKPIKVPKKTVNAPIVEKTATEVIKPKNSIYTSQEKAESYVKWHEKELQNP